MSTWTQRFRGGTLAARSARAAVRERLAGQFGEPVLSDVELLVSELATNSVRHGGAGESAELSLELEVTDECVRLAWCDPGPGFEETLKPAPHTEREGGYGLVLLDRLATTWGVQRNGSFCVWFEIAHVAARRPVPA